MNDKDDISNDNENVKNDPVDWKGENENDGNNPVDENDSENASNDGN